MKPRHEIVLVYSADLVDKWLYNKEKIDGLETAIDPPLPMLLFWKTLEETDQEGLPLYPESLRKILGD